MFIFTKEPLYPKRINTEKSDMRSLEREYDSIYDRQDLRADELDYSILDRHIEVLDRAAKMSNSGVTIYDLYKRNHAFTSYNFPELFDYDMEQIKAEDGIYFNSRLHPDDWYEWTLNMMKFLQFVFDTDDKMRYKLIFEYRIEMGGKYIRMIEQIQALECDNRGNVWLALCLLDISPNQTPFTRVESRIFDKEARRTIAMPDYPEFKTFEKNTACLTKREKEILILVREGFLSKEISDRLDLSVNTVNTYRQHIIEKFDVNNSQEAIRYAEKFGLLD